MEVCFVKPKKEPITSKSNCSIFLYVPHRPVCQFWKPKFLKPKKPKQCFGLHRVPRPSIDSSQTKHMISCSNVVIYNWLVQSGSTSSTLIVLLDVSCNPFLNYHGTPHKSKRKKNSYHVSQSFVLLEASNVICKHSLFLLTFQGLRITVVCKQDTQYNHTKRG